jgi:hypothetical protein
VPALVLAAVPVTGALRFGAPSEITRLRLVPVDN